MRLLFAAFIAAVLLPNSAVAGSSPPQPGSAPPPLPAGAVLIVTPATADLSGYRIVISSDGSAVAEDGAGKGQQVLSTPLVKTLHADLDSAMPLSKLPSSPCAGQPQAAARLLITYHGETSPDLTCATDARAAALYADAQSIVRAMYVANYRVRTVTIHGGNQPSSSGPAQPQPSQPVPLPPSMPSGGYGYM